MARLETTLGRADPAPRRAYLAACFAAPVYDAHRAAIIRALLGPAPSYTFTALDPDTGQPAAVYLISWHLRDRNGGAYAKAIRRVRTGASQLPGSGGRPLAMQVTAELDRAIRGEWEPPVVEQVPPQWAAALMDAPALATAPAPAKVEQVTPHAPAAMPDAVEEGDTAMASDTASDGLWEVDDSTSDSDAVASTLGEEEGNG